MATSRTTNYPSDAELSEWAKTCRTQTELATMCGVKRESLRDYLRIRPDLKREVLSSLDRPSREQVLANEKRAKRNWVLANPDKKRAYNRKWAKNQDPAKRARWNTYNRLRRQGLTPEIMSSASVEYASLIRNDPCSYFCDSPGKTLDHIIPVARGGKSEWTNFTGACQSCNSSKSDDNFLTYLLRKAVSG